MHNSNNNKTCHYCGKVGHIAKDCYKKQANQRAKANQQGHYASSNHAHGSTPDQLFAMTHVQGDKAIDVGLEDVWYIDSGASNHMTPHGEWFEEMNPGTHGYVCTGDDTQHDITHTGVVPLVMHDGQTKKLKEVLHVPSITKNLLSVGQMAEQNLQVRFNKHGFTSIYKS